MSIVITIEDTHPQYLDLLEYVEKPDCRSGGFVLIEQHAGGIWTWRLAHVTPTLRSLQSNPYSAPIRIERR